MIKKLGLVFIGLLIIGNSVSAQDLPPLPFYDKGACPFECCTYSDWTAMAQVLAYRDPGPTSKVAFTLTTGQVVTAITGFVVTTRVGSMRVVKSVTFGYDRDDPAKDPRPGLSLVPGDLIYTLHYVGAGWDLFWYRGHLYEDQIEPSNLGTGRADEGAAFERLSDPETVWWVEVRTKDGRRGWVKNPGDFSNVDACG